MTNTENNASMDNFWLNLKNKSENAIKKGKMPLIIVDLDGTLVDYTMRTYSIFQEMPNNFDLPDNVRDIILSIKPSEFHYHPRENLNSVGIEDSELVDQLSAFWEKSFLSNYYLHYDIPLDGSEEFIRNILDHGINIVYLTGRDEENMGMGTRTWLQKYNLHPLENRTRLLLKTDMSLINYQAKDKNCEIIKTLGEPVLIIDNEPIELATTWGRFPEAIGILMETQNTGRKAELPANTIRMPNFLELNSKIEIPSY